MKNSTHPLAHVFSEHASPQHMDRATFRDELKKWFGVISKMQKQLIQYKTATLEAALTEQPDGRGPTYEHVHQTFAVLEREVNAIALHCRGAMQGYDQLDRYLAEIDEAEKKKASLADPKPD